MPLLDIQQRAAQIGRIRIGMKVKTDRGSRPAKLETFRFTTGSRHAADAISALLGGQARAWEDAPTSGQWEVVTDVSALPVAIPPGEAVSQWYEMWTAAGCARRCDGVQDRLSGDPCLCPSDQGERAERAKTGDACRATTRVNVLIPDLPGLGTWMLESHGYYAAVELGGTAEVLSNAAGRGLVVPAMLRIEQRKVRRPGQKPKEFPVPVLEVLPTMRELTAAAEGGGRLQAALPPPVRPVAALTAGHDPLTPAGGVVTVASLAAAALCAASDAELRSVWDRAASAGLLDDYVDVPTSEVMEQLREVIKQRKTEIAEGRQS